MCRREVGHKGKNELATRFFAIRLDVWKIGQVGVLWPGWKQRILYTKDDGETVQWVQESVKLGFGAIRECAPKQAQAQPESRASFEEVGQCLEKRA